MTYDAKTGFCRPCAELTAAAAERETGRLHRARVAFRQPVGIRKCTHCALHIERAFHCVEEAQAA